MKGLKAIKTEDGNYQTCIVISEEAVLWYIRIQRIIINMIATTMLEEVFEEIVKNRLFIMN